MKYRKILIAAQVVLLIIACGFVDQVLTKVEIETIKIRYVVPVSNFWRCTKNLRLAKGR